MTTPLTRQFIIDLIHNEYDPIPDLGDASYKAFDDSWDDGTGRIADAILALCKDAATPPSVPVSAPAVTQGGERWRHKKRGTTYAVLGHAQVQCSDGLTDYELVTVYRGEQTGELWARRKSEFEDERRRFEQIETPPPAKVDAVGSYYASGTDHQDGGVLHTVHGFIASVDKFENAKLIAKALNALASQPVTTKKTYIKPLRTLVEIDARYADQIRDLLNASGASSDPAIQSRTGKPDGPAQS